MQDSCPARCEGLYLGSSNGQQSPFSQSGGCVAGQHCHLPCLGTITTLVCLGTVTIFMIFALPMIPWLNFGDLFSGKILIGQIRDKRPGNGSRDTGDTSRFTNLAQRPERQIKTHPIVYGICLEQKA